jgi:hypothetical protein
MERGTCFGEMRSSTANRANRRPQNSPQLCNGAGSGTAYGVPLPRARFERLLERRSLGAHKLVLGTARMLSQRHCHLTQQLTELAVAEYPLGRVHAHGVGDPPQRLLDHRRFSVAHENETAIA